MCRQPIIAQTLRHRHLTLFSSETVKRITFLGMGIIYPIIISELPVPCPGSSPNRFLQVGISLCVCMLYMCAVGYHQYGKRLADPMRVHVGRTRESGNESDGKSILFIIRMRAKQTNAYHRKDIEMVFNIYIIFTLCCMCVLYM